MAGDEINMTVKGNLTADPELRFTPSGAAVANFTIAATPRSFDRQTNEWKDGETIFQKCAAWRDKAENVSETLSKGMRAFAEGTLKAKQYETKSGEKRTDLILEVSEVGPSLSHATAKVTRATKGGGGNKGGGSSQQGGNNQGGWGDSGGGQQGGGAPADEDPWARSAPADDDPWA